MIRTLTTQQRLVGATMEGVYGLAALLLRLGESALLLAAFSRGGYAAYGVAAVGALCYSLLLAPLRLGRQMWYCALMAGDAAPSVGMLWKGFRRFRGAVSWRWSRFWRLAVLLLAVSVPAALLWGYGDRLTRLGDSAYSLLLVVLGGLALLGGLAVWCARRCRYCLVPLLLARGYTAPLAMQLSIGFTRGRTAAWINFWGGQVGWLVLCGLVPPAALWVLPAVWWRYTGLLTAWLGEEAGKTCIFPTVPI